MVATYIGLNISLVTLATKCSSSGSCPVRIVEMYASRCMQTVPDTHGYKKKKEYIHFVRYV